MASKKIRKMKKDLGRLKRNEKKERLTNKQRRLFKHFTKDAYGGLHIGSTYVSNTEAVEEAQRRLDVLTRRLRITSTYTFDNVTERDLITVLDGSLEKSVENGLVKFVQQGFVIATDRGEGVRKFLDVMVLSKAKTLSQLESVINIVSAQLKSVKSKGRQTAYQIVWYSRFQEGTLY